MDEITVARIRRAHGLTGELQVQSETGDGLETFQPGRRFKVRAVGRDAARATLTLETSRPHKGGFLLRFAEVSDLEGARRLLGAELLLGLNELRPLDEGEFFLHDLVGLEIIEPDGSSPGTIADVYDAGGQILAAVVLEDRERLFPIRPETVRRIDIKARKIEVSLPAGLLEL